MEEVALKRRKVYDEATSKIKSARFDISKTFVRGEDPEKTLQEALELIHLEAELAQKVLEVDPSSEEVRDSNVPSKSLIPRPVCI